MHTGEATNKFSLMLGITSNIRVQKAHFLAIRCTGIKLHGDEGSKVLKQIVAECPNQC